MYFRKKSSLPREVKVVIFGAFKVFSEKKCMILQHLKNRIVFKVKTNQNQ